MARPTKCRRVCHLPETLEFYPTGEAKGSPIILKIDEFEAIRLIDIERLSQEECGAQLGVGRTTAQKIYDAARKKLADAMVLGLPLKIEGGDVNICNGNAAFCYRKNCLKQQIQTEYKINKRSSTIRIAVTYKNGNVFQHFGHTEQFKVYDFENNKIVKTEVIDINGSGHGALAGILSAIGADVLICGGIGDGAKMFLNDAGITLYGNVIGNADSSVEAFLADNLDYHPEPKCNHHGRERGAEKHICSEQSCDLGNC